MFAQIVKGCASKEGASDADVNEVFALKPPSTISGKCLHACIGSTTGAVSRLLIIENCWTYF